MGSLDLNIEFQPKQEQAIDALNAFPVLFYGGAKGGGKSWLVRAWQLLRRLKYPKTNGVIIRKTYPELNANHIEKILSEYPALRSYYSKSEKSIRLPNGSKLDFKYLRHTDDVYNFQGLEYEDIALDECTQHSEEVFKILRSSNRTTNPDISPKFLLTGNPGGIGHAWVKRIFIDNDFAKYENENDYAFVQAFVEDNAKLMENDPSYLIRLKALPEQKRKAYLEGNWDIFQGQFFETFRSSKHVIQPRYDLKEAPPNWEYILCWDEGMSAPRAVHLLAIDGDGKVEIIWEYYKTNETAAEAARYMVAELQRLGLYDRIRRRCKFVYDPSMNIRSNQTGKSSADIVASILGMNKEPGNNSRVEGWRRMKEYMAWDELTDPNLHVWETCENFIRTIPSLIYDDNSTDDCDTDGEDHCADAVRYGIMSIKRLPSRMKGDKNVVKSFTRRRRTHANPITGI